jgi:protocatechuate 3,4-dioxygenase beta subunit
MAANHDPSRRRFLLSSAVAATGFGLTPEHRRAFAQQGLPPTPACGDHDAPTLRQTEGPFFKPRSPERSDLRQPGLAGRPLELSGMVLTRGCKPVAGALVDLWHADDKGDYDNTGFRLRGHVFADAQGRYLFRTIVPGAYEGRTRHFHVKVQAPNRPVLTTQFYFPDEPKNRIDSLFRRELLMQVAQGGEGAVARFDVVLDIR